MREFWSKFKTLVEVYFSNPALFWAGFTLTIVFAIVGMIVSIKIWLPIVAVILIAVLIAASIKAKVETVSPEREQLIRQVVSYVVFQSLRGKFPYKMDVPPKEILAKRILVRKYEGIEIATVSLLHLEKTEVDLSLLNKIFNDRFQAVVDITPGLGLKACGDMYSLLTLIELQKLDEEIQLRIVIADNWLAVRFLDNWFQEELNRQKRGKHYE